MKKLSFLTVISAMLLTTTSYGSVIESALDTAGRTIGQAAGRAVGEHIVRTYSPQFTNVYASYMITYAFTPGGYSIETAPYAEGEWTRWRFVEDGEETGSWVERSFLKKTDDGEQWWRVTMYDAGSDDTTVLEALFDAGRENLLRLRSKFPDQEISEMPVEEGTTAVFSDPIDLTAESIEGATIETVSIRVPAGSFTARRVRFGDMASGGSAEWWLVDDVPGGYVKYATSASRSGEEVEGLDSWNFTLELIDRGTGATTQLDSYR